MRFAIFKGEKTLADLVARIFPSSSSAPAEGQQATDILLSANPHLADLTQVLPGSRVVVPETTLPADPSETTAAAGTSMSHKATLIYQHLDSLKTSIPAAASVAVANANATLVLLQRAEVKAAAANDPSLARRVQSVTQQANARIEAAQKLQNQYLQSIGPIQAALTKSI